MRSGVAGAEPPVLTGWGDHATVVCFGSHKRNHHQRAATRVDGCPRRTCSLTVDRGYLVPPAILAESSMAVGFCLSTSLSRRLRKAAYSS